MVISLERPVSVVYPRRHGLMGLGIGGDETGTAQVADEIHCRSEPARDGRTSVSSPIGAFSATQKFHRSD
jgi:hypothetical protein